MIASFLFDKKGRGKKSQMRIRKKKQNKSEPHRLSHAKIRMDSVLPFIENAVRMLRYRIDCVISGSKCVFFTSLLGLLIRRSVVVLLGIFLGCFIVGVRPVFCDFDFVCVSVTDICQH